MPGQCNPSQIRWSCGAKPSSSVRFWEMVPATSNLRLPVLSVAVLVVVACSPVGTKGTMPPPGPNGERDLNAAPDFIAVVAGDSGEVGYVPKPFFFREGMTPRELPRGDPGRSTQRISGR
jgi:hypothetical protein